MREGLALAHNTGRLETVSLFGSFVIANMAPADRDLCFVMSHDFSTNEAEGRARLLCDRSRAAIVWGIGGE